MKSFKSFRKLAVVCTMTQCLALSAAYVVPAAEAVTYSSTDNQSARFGDEYTWYYKKENGKLYKRLYNNSAQRWESEWIFVRNL